MAKNNALIQQYRTMQKQINLLTPNIYSAIAIAMHREGYTFEQIERVFAESQTVWNECVQNDVRMPEMCYEETGIDVLGTANGGVRDGL